MVVNTRLLTHEFDYLVPGTLEEALQLLNQYGPEAKILAGGTDLISRMKYEKVRPAYVIDIKNIAGLNHIEEGEVVKIGAANNFQAVMEFFRPSIKHAALYEAIYGIGKTQVLNMGTIGGNLSNGSPKADTAPPLLVFNGRVKLVSEQEERVLDLQDFHKGFNKTVLAPNELMTEIQFDAFPDGKASAFEKKTRVGGDISKISCAVAVERDGDVCTSCCIALGAAAPVPMRTPEAENMLNGKSIDEALIEKAGQQVAKEIKPPEAGRTSAEYRRHVAAVMFGDVFRKAWRRAGGEEK